VRNWLRRKNQQQKVLVIGLDCAEPSLVFERWRDDLPTLSRLMDEGAWGPLESVTPPITVPAWSCMMSGRDPGELGIYGFRNRADYSYDRLSIANSDAVQVPRAWEVLSNAGKRVTVIGVPGTYPPKPVNGHLITSFLTPSTKAQFTYPPDLRDDVFRWTNGDYMLDVREFRTDNKDWLLEQIYSMTNMRFDVAEHLIRERPWDFFMLVEMGTDRIHHGFWRYSAPDHRLYEPGNPYENAIRDYYRHIDGRIAKLLEHVPDDTIVMIVSDHGAKTMDGGIRINEWLRREGYLTLKEEPDGIVPFDIGMVDWSRTTAWGEGGYYARIFFNMEGREPEGIVPAAEATQFRAELKAKLEAIPDEDGHSIGTRVFIPGEVYHEVRGFPPDLIVYLGDLAWRSIGTVGGGTIHARENDTGPDDANHAPYGICIYHDPRSEARGRLEGLHLFDVGRTILSQLDVPPPPGMKGTNISEHELIGAVPGGRRRTSTVIRS
jgi:predicted AlkP superfamily phosphohydrolase/phosphomutase